MFTTKNEIKKALYKQKPTAEFMKADAVGLHYHTRIEEWNVYFTIPYTDAATGNFYPSMDGQYLNRWVDDPNP